MTVTLLLDLDDTLLSNKMQVFLPAYMDALSRYVASIVRPDIFLTHLMDASWQMVQNQDPDCLLKDVFDANFYPRLGIEKDAITPLIDQFYAEIFPTLKPLTQPRPAAIRLVEEALKRNYQLAVATSPLFPLTAVRQRLEWAGLPPSEVPFALIASYETFHFAKPRPAFLAEMLARLGWPDRPVMVGNDPNDDIPCAEGLGVSSFLLTGEKTGIINSNGKSASGSLDDVLDWIEATPDEHLAPDYTSPSAIQAILTSTPGSIRTLIGELPVEQWSLRSHPDEWSLTEILCHLRDVEQEVNLPRLNKVTSERNPFVPGEDTDKWAEVRSYILQDGLIALSRFSTARRMTCELLGKLSPEDWLLPARHAIFGPTHLNEIASIIAGHDRLHIQQILKVIETSMN